MLLAQTVQLLICQSLRSIEAQWSQEPGLGVQFLGEAERRRSPLYRQVFQIYLMNDIENVVGAEVIQEIDPGPRLTSARTLAEIVVVMDDILDQLELHTQKKQRPGIPSWVEKAHTLVEERFRDQNRTVAYVADQFDLTPTYCSKVFREKYNIRSFDFIQLKRLAAAKKLMETSKNLKEIAQDTVSLVDGDSAYLVILDGWGDAAQLTAIRALQAQKISQAWEQADVCAGISHNALGWRLVGRYRHWIPQYHFRL